MSAITATGGPVVVTIGAVLAVLGLAAARRRQDAVFVAVAVLTCIGFRLIVVNLVARPRPADRLVAAAGWSFPSGHTTASAVAAVAVIVVGGRLLRRTWQRWALTAAALAWAVAVGVSRVALVVHWPTDVLGAWLFVGTIVFALGAVRAVAGTPRTR
ncbi:phosphatase PAP2 family protein [Actinoplanes sp. NPDC051513]|uniref:phosphatase PAP2 family protein n=1 Tax=Actinoplanes sp. NPDC051513 TaxID=3363908 RepID=UPI00378A9706